MLYYPCMLAFALAPPLVTQGAAGITVYNAPFAAGAFGGMLLTVECARHRSPRHSRPFDSRTAQSQVQNAVDDL
jgi:hypothetical protein